MIRFDDARDLVSTSWLADHLHDPNVRIVDVRWYLDNRRGEDAYRSGHLPGAIHLNVDKDLAAPTGPNAPGRHPLPVPVSFADLLSSIGVGPSTQVIAYDDDGGSRAARLWWMLRYFGHGLGGVLDGGWNQWLAEGRPVTKTVPRISRAQPMELVALPRFVVDKSLVIELQERESALILDARVPERYAGLEEPFDPRAGHIPGALNAPYVDNLVATGGVFRPVSDLREHFLHLGVEPNLPVVVYCGSGITACHTILALHLAGFSETQLYEGSWSDWSRDPSLPIKTGLAP